MSWFSFEGLQNLPLTPDIRETLTKITLFVRRATNG